MIHLKKSKFWIVLTLVFSLTGFFFVFTPTLSAQVTPDIVQLKDYVRDFETAYFYLVNAYVDEPDPTLLYEGAILSMADYMKEQGMDVSENKDFQSLKDSYDIEEALLFFLESNKVETDVDTLFSYAMNGMFDSLGDPYTVFLEDMFLQDMEEITEGSFGGVGLYITSEILEEGKESFYLPYVRVVAPIEGTPAYKAGVHSGDYIIEIEGESAEGFTSEDVSKLLRGKPNTDVNVTFLQAGNIRYNVNITRAVIEIPTVKYDLLTDNTGYLRIIEFTPYTAGRVEEALNYFLNEDCDSLVIDVRSNPGGLLSSVVDVCDYFFSRGTIVSTRSRIRSENKVFDARSGSLVPRNWDIAVLIDQGSASASEILTGAFKDRERATIIGQTSYGKGSVQQFIRLGEENAIKLTTARYYTPNDINIDKTGIDPDIFVEEPELAEEELDSFRILVENHYIPLFVSENPNPSNNQINRFIKKLIEEEEINLDEDIFHRMIQSELNRRMDNPPVFSLEYDRILQKALEVIEEER